mgnify:CR=1 FL=1
MRKILFIICWALAGVGLYSCSLDEPSYGKTTSDNYYQKESDIEQALTGAYLQLRTTWNEYALNHYFVGDCSTDDALKGGGNDGDRAEVRDLSDFTIYTTNGEVGRRWEILYRLINRCNDVIYYAPDAIGNEELLKRYANEAKALRAFGYYCLVTTFGEVPLITTPMQPAEILQIPRSPLEKVYECIVNDLTDASALPAKGDYSEDDAYRATRGFAKTMLAKTYMFKGDFTSAETVLHDIIEVDKDYTLLSDYGMNWRTEYENSSESVFEIANKVYDKNIATGTNVPHFFTSRRISGYQGYGFHVPTQDLHDAFDADDPRITYVFTQTGDRYKGDTEAHEKLGKIEEMMESAVEEVLTEQAQTEPSEDDINPSDYVHYVFDFQTLEAVVAFAKAIDFPVEASELYKDGGLYHMTILLDLQNHPSYYANLMYARLLEYASTGTKTRAYLQEHGLEMLADDAVVKLKMIELV